MLLYMNSSEIKRCEVHWNPVQNIAFLLSAHMWYTFGLNILLNAESDLAKRV